MLHAKSLPDRLLVEALNCATYIQNKSPHRYVKDVGQLRGGGGN
jgi:hypothetical protein